MKLWVRVRCLVFFDSRCNKLCKSHQQIARVMIMSNTCRLFGNIQKLRQDKAGGADELVPRLLILIKDEISYPLT